MSKAEIVIQTMQRSQWKEVAELIHDSTNQWYQNQGKPKIFVHGPESTLLFCEVYEALDPGCCLVAIDRRTNSVVGSCFYHPRDTHVSLGIMNVAADQFGRGIARSLLEEIKKIASDRQLPIRLVSSAMNLDSYSLYNRAGFRPMTVYQDMIVQIPEAGIETPESESNNRIRPAKTGDIEAMVKLEMEISGIKRDQDYRYFVTNELGIWKTLVLESEPGRITGFLSSVRHPASNMFGPGVARSESVALDLIFAMLEFHRGCSPVVLVPANSNRITQALYRFGAKNCELHLAQCLGEWQPSSGVVIPTFMPETG